MKKLYVLLLLMTAFTALAKEVIPIETPVSFPGAARLSEYTIRMPFNLVGNLITVEASVNGKSGPFIIDTGSYAMVLNKRIYGAGDAGHNYTYSVNRELGAVSEASVYEFWIDDFEVNANQADLIDLSKIEMGKKSRINGILGYQNLKNFEVYIDFYLQQITLFKLKGNGDRHDFKFMTDEVIDTLAFQRKKHSIIIESAIAGQKMSFVLDTGAEINQLNKNVHQVILQNFQPLQRVQMVGMDGEGEEVIAGNFKSFDLSPGFKCLQMPTIITTMDFAREAYGTTIDGVLGYWFLKDRRVIINYRKKKLLFTKWPQ